MENVVLCNSLSTDYTTSVLRFPVFCALVVASLEVYFKQDQITSMLSVCKLRVDRKNALHVIGRGIKRNETNVLLLYHSLQM